MSVPELPENQRVVPINDSILRLNGIKLGKHARILDFGCGNGRHVYEYLDADYDRVFGFDIRDRTEYIREDSDRGRFRFLEDGETFRIPFPNDYFDFVTSTSVFEHVQDKAHSIAEIARVLKPGGATLHVFPSRWRPIEPHLKVPFSGVIHSSWWFSLWAWLGIRNRYQRECTPWEVSAANRISRETDLYYLGGREILRLWHGSFGSVLFVERDFVEATREVSTVSRFVWPLAKTLPLLITLYRAGHTRVVLARNPISEGHRSHG